MKGVSAAVDAPATSEMKGDSKLTPKRKAKIAKAVDAPATSDVDGSPS